MLFNLTRNSEKLFQVLDAIGSGKQRQVLHDTEHDLGPCPAGIQRIGGEKLTPHLLENLVGIQVLSLLSSR
jgi:hypothetical protein